MIIQRLALNQLRVFDSEAEFDFNNRMNLLVGVNGAGKSTTLEAIRILLTQMVGDIVDDYAERPDDFSASDIAYGRDVLVAEMDVRVAGTPISYIRNMPREKTKADKDREGEVRHQTFDTSDIKEWTSPSPSSPNHPSEIRQEVEDRTENALAIFFSPERSVVKRKEASKGTHGGGKKAAYASALSPQKFEIRRLGQWLRVQETLMEDEDDQHGRRLHAVEMAVSRFLQRYQNLRGVDGEGHLLIDQGDKTLQVAQLSDGERGVLSLVLDITTRLAQANPDSDNPLEEEAIVLIDEIDLHLHPGWQRSISDLLLDTFENCQFICTTHSPQVISEVEPESLFILKQSEEEGIVVRRPNQSYGLDTNWILESLMDVQVRPPEVEEKIEAVEDALEVGELNKARFELESLRDLLHGYDPVVSRLEASIRNLQSLADEANPEEP